MCERDSREIVVSLVGVFRTRSWQRSCLRGSGPTLCGESSSSSNKPQQSLCLLLCCCWLLIVVRRSKNDVEKDLPPKDEVIIDVEMTDTQKKYYKATFA